MPDKQTLKNIFAAFVNQETLEDAANWMASLAKIHPELNDEFEACLQEGVVLGDSGSNMVVEAVNESGYQVDDSQEAGRLCAELLSLYRNAFNDPELHEVKQFLSSYFHQDWIEEHKTWQSVTEFYVRETQPSIILLVAMQIEKLLQAPISEGELLKKVQHLGCYYWPGSEPDYRIWLKELAAYLLRLSANLPFDPGVARRST